MRVASPTGKPASTGTDHVARGAVYTPEFLAHWLAGEVLQALPDGPLTVADLACGQAALLRAISKQRRGVRLIGVDVDLDDLRVAAAALPTSRFLPADALTLVERPGLGTVDGVVLNPPWGVTLTQDATALRKMGYSLARGQFDSANLFVELALNVLRPGGVGGFILPDSIFFPEHAAVRRLLLERTELLLVARLGEGFFRNVFRGTAVIVLRNGAPRPGHAVRCLRLSADERRAVLSEERTLEAVAAERSHHISQTRFSGTSLATFDICVRREQAPLITRLDGRRGMWARWFDSGRGVELSKSGKVVRCPSCGYAWPLPLRPRTLICRECATASWSATLEVETLVRPLSGGERGWAQLIAGVDVRRYRCTATREIQTGVPGIDYKTGRLRRGPRILIRKTGVGLNAVLTDTEALTTQVVFDYVPTAAAPAFVAPYVQGVLSSRIMLAYHLLVSGENEWRSHPYVTQRVINDLPIPDRGDGDFLRQATAIARATRYLTSRPEDLATDLALEGLVAGLFGLERADLQTVAAVLDEAEGLEAIRGLRFDHRQIAPTIA